MNPGGPQVIDAGLVSEFRAAVPWHSYELAGGCIFELPNPVVNLRPDGPDMHNAQAIQAMRELLIEWNAICFDDRPLSETLLIAFTQEVGDLYRGHFTVNGPTLCERLMRAVCEAHRRQSTSSGAGGEGRK